MAGKNILLVEDNQDDIDLTIRALRKSNILNEIIVKKDGEEALAYLFNEVPADIEKIPAVILLDINMPKVNGIEVLKQIKENERTKHIPVVMLTTSKEEKDLFDSYNLGCNSYIRKPVDFNQFADAVKGVGLYWLVLNEPLPHHE